MICETCLESKSSCTNGICDLCRYILFRESSSSLYDVSFKSRDGIVLWIKDKKIVSAWSNNGQTTIPKIAFENKPILESIMDIRLVIDEEKCWCSDCGKVIGKDEIESRQFAGQYCKDCTLKRDKGATRCRKCGRLTSRCEC